MVDVGAGAGDVWVTQAEALGRLAVSQRSFRRLVERGQVRRLHIPPARPRYCLKSIEDLLARHTSPAPAGR